MTVTLTDIVTEGFLKKHTTWESLEQFEEAAPLKIKEEDYWQFINKPEFNQYIADHSAFCCWNTFLKRATEEFIEQRFSY